MGLSMRAPSGQDRGSYESLYLARGSDVAVERPLLTGDVYEDARITSPIDGSITTATVMILQHPCALRQDGVTLNPVLLAAVVNKHKPISDWDTHTKLMPLPDLYPMVDSQKRNQAGMFDRLVMVSSAQLESEAPRVACLSQEGIAILFQRWIFASTRALVEFERVNEVIAGPFAEAEIIEEWCCHAATYGVPTTAAVIDCLGWLREDAGDGMRQRLLDRPELRSAIRRESIAFRKARSAADWTTLA